MFILYVTSLCMIFPTPIHVWTSFFPAWSLPPYYRFLPRVAVLLTGYGSDFPHPPADLCTCPLTPLSLWRNAFLTLLWLWFLTLGCLSPGHLPHPLVLTPHARPPVFNHMDVLFTLLGACHLMPSFPSLCPSPCRSPPYPTGLWHLFWSRAPLYPHHRHLPCSSSANNFKIEIFRKRRPQLSHLKYEEIEVQVLICSLSRVTEQMRNNVSTNPGLPEFKLCESRELASLVLYFIPRQLAHCLQRVEWINKWIIPCLVLFLFFFVILTYVCVYKNWWLYVFVYNQYKFVPLYKCQHLNFHALGFLPSHEFLKFLAG